MSIGSLGSSSQSFRDFLGGSQQDIGRGLQDVLSTYQDPSGNFGRLANRANGMFELSDSEYSTWHYQDAQNNFAEGWIKEYRAVLQLRAEALKKKLTRSFSKVLDRSATAPINPDTNWAPEANRDQNDIKAFNSQQLPTGITGVASTTPATAVTVPETYVHTDWFSGSGKSTSDAYLDIRRYINTLAPPTDIDGDDIRITWDDTNYRYDVPTSDDEENQAGGGLFSDYGDVKDGYPNGTSGAWPELALENNVGPSTDLANFYVSGDPDDNYWYTMTTDAVPGDLTYNPADPGGVGAWPVGAGIVTAASDPVFYHLWENGGSVQWQSGSPGGGWTEYRKFKAGTIRYDSTRNVNALDTHLFTPYNDFGGVAFKDSVVTNIKINTNLTNPSEPNLPAMDAADVSSMKPYEQGFVDSWMEARQIQRREAQVEAAYQAYREGSQTMIETGGAAATLSYKKRMDMVFSALDQLFDSSSGGGSGGAFDMGGGDTIDVSGSMGGASTERDLSMISPYGDYVIPPITNATSNPVGSGALLGETSDHVLESDNRPIDEDFKLRASTAILTGASTQNEATGDISVIVNDHDKYAVNDWISFNYKRSDTVKVASGAAGNPSVITVPNTTKLNVGETLLIEHSAAGLTAANIVSKTATTITLDALIDPIYFDLGTGTTEVYHSGQEFGKITAKPQVVDNNALIGDTVPEIRSQITSAAIAAAVGVGDYVTMNDGSTDVTMQVRSVAGNVVVFGDAAASGPSSLPASFATGSTFKATVEKLTIVNASRTPSTDMPVAAQNLMLDAEVRNAVISKVQTISVGAGYEDLGKGDKLIVDTITNPGADLGAKAPGATALEVKIGQEMNMDGTFLVTGTFYRDATGSLKAINPPSTTDVELVTSGGAMFNPATRIHVVNDANIKVGDRIEVAVTGVTGISGTSNTTMLVTVNEIDTTSAGLVAGQAYFIIDPLDQGKVDTTQNYNEWQDPGGNSGTINTIYSHGRDHNDGGAMVRADYLDLANAAKRGQEDSDSVYQMVYNQLGQGASMAGQPPPDGMDVVPGLPTILPNPVAPDPSTAAEDDGALYNIMPYGAADGGGANINLEGGAGDLKDTLGQSYLTDSLPNPNMDEISRFFTGRQWDQVPGVLDVGAGTEGAGLGAVKYEADLIASHVIALPGWYGGSGDQQAGPDGFTVLSLQPAIDGFAVQKFASNVNWGKIDDAMKIALAGSFLRVGGASDAAGIIDLDGSSSKYNVGVGFGLGVGGLFWGHTSAIGRLTDIAQLNAKGPIIDLLQSAVGGLKAIPGLGDWASELSIFPNIGIAGFNFDFNIPIPIPMPTGPVTFLNIPLTVVGGASFDYMTWFFKEFLENLKHKVLDSVSVYSYATTGGTAMDSYGMRGEYQFAEMGALESLRTFPELGPIKIGEVIGDFVSMFANTTTVNQAGTETVEDRTMLYKPSVAAPEARELDTGAFFSTAAFLSQFQLNKMEYSYWTGAHQNEEVANMDMLRTILVSGKELIKAVTKGLFGMSGQDTKSVTGIITNTILNMLLGTLQDSIAQGVLYDLIFHDQDQTGFSVPINITKSKLQAEGYDFIEDDVKLFEGDFESVSKDGFIKNLVGSFAAPRQQLDGLANTRRFKPGKTGVDPFAGRQGFKNWQGGNYADGTATHLDPWNGQVDNGWSIHKGFWEDKGLGDTNEVYTRKNIVKWGAMNDGFSTAGGPTVTAQMDRYVGSQNRIIGRGYDPSKPLDLTRFSTGYLADKYFGTDIGTAVISNTQTIDGHANSTFNMWGGKNFYDRKRDYSLTVNFTDDAGGDITLDADAALAPTIGGRIKIGEIDRNDGAEVLGKDSIGDTNALNQELYRHLRIEADGSNTKLVKEYRDVFNMGFMDHVFITSSSNTAMGGGLTSSIHMNYDQLKGLASQGSSEQNFFKNSARGVMEIYLDSFFAFRRKPQTGS